MSSRQKIKLKESKRAKKEGLAEKRSEKRGKDEEKSEKLGPNSAVIRLSHVPYGFFEKEMNNYFTQFGTVKRVRLVRNNKGHSSGIAFVQFTLVEVAEIAAESMDNYIMADKRMRCRVLREKELPKSIQYGPLFCRIPEPMENRIRHAREHFNEKTELQERRQRERLALTLKRRMKKIAEMGIDYHFDYRSKLKQFPASNRRTRQAEKEKEGEEPEVEKELEEEMETEELADAVET